MSTSPSDRDPVERLAEEIAERYRRGERPSLSEYTALHPELAEEIRVIFPALVAMEQFGSEVVPPATPTTSATSRSATVPEKLGEYRLLREVGRGGMGVVYEAVQESLGRHVALKVLPDYRVRMAGHLDRFRREARAAAQLHHSNIVPVFGVGEYEGIHFYAMQFIQGKGLEIVLQEVKRLRGKGHNGLKAEAGSSGSAALARGLTTGRYTEGEPDAAAGGDLDSRGKNCFRRPDVDDQATLGLREPTAEVTTSLPESDYYRAVARVGMQVAEALAYAHRNHVIHRDIKPSNLLLDTQGIVWITDFGLAKVDDGDDLTRTGDLVGTVRYMAPERFLGHEDPRCDIYGLGLTLYEMLTFRPAFGETNRGKLIDQIRHSTPPAPRTLDPRIPRDLETVILKSMAKETADRYQSAAALAEDLRRFLTDRPIQARRSYIAEQLWRWCRRNPAWASLLATAAVLLIVAGIASWLREERNQAIANWGLAVDATHREAESRAEAEAQRHLAQARAYRYSGRVGQRFKALDEIAAAAKFRPSLELRNEAIACLALTDLRLATQYDIAPPGTKILQIDQQFERYARSDELGNIVVRRLADDALCQKFPGFGHWAYVMDFSKDGRYLAALYDVEWNVHIWDLKTGLEVWKRSCERFRLSPDGRSVVLQTKSDRAYQLAIYETATGKLKHRVVTPTLPTGLSFDSTGKQLAAALGQGPNGICIWILDADTMTRIAHPTALGGIDWSSNGKYLAACNPDGGVHIWNTATGNQQAGGHGHAGPPGQVGFSHNGDLLLTNGSDRTVRLWDPLTGHLLFTLEDGWNWPFSPPFFSLDDHHLIALSNAQPASWDVANGLDACRTLRSVSVPHDLVYAVDFSPNGRWLMMSCGRGACIWDYVARREVAFLEESGMDRAVFDPSDGSLLTCGRKGLHRWPITQPSASTAARIGPPILIGNAEFVTAASLSADGHTVGVAAGWPNGKALLVPPKESSKPTKLIEQRWLHDIAVSPDGQWAATGVLRSDQTKCTQIMDTRTGRIVREFSAEEVQGNAGVYFSPDGRWLATVSNRGDRLWEVGTWKPGIIKPIRQTSHSALAFSRDGKLLAIGDNTRRVVLLDPNTGNELAEFPITPDEPALALAFSPDGCYLACASNTHRVQIWDIRYIRLELAKIGLDWDQPSLPPASAALPPILEMKIARATPTPPPSVPPTREQILQGQVGVESLVLRSDPFDSAAYHRRGLALSRLGHVSRAIADYNVALALHPQSDNTRATWLTDRSSAHLLLKQTDNAVADLQQALAIEPNRIVALNNLAFIYSNGDPAYRDLDKALTFACKAVALDQKHWQARHTLAVTYYRLGRYNEAIVNLERCLREGKQERGGFHFVFLAMCHSRLGDREQAKECYGKALSWKPPRPDLLPNDWNQRMAAARTEAEAVFAEVDAKK